MLQRNVFLLAYCLCGLLFDHGDWATTFLRNVDKRGFYQTTLPYTPEHSNCYDRENLTSHKY